MINNLNVGSLSSTETAPLIERIARRVDGNNDGNISKSEFSQFLADLLHKIGGANDNSLSTLASTASETAEAALPPCLIGWNPEKWVNPNHTTPKYVVGRLLAEHPPTPDGLKQALASVQNAIPGTTLVGLDKLQIPNVGLIDVGHDFRAGGGVGWGWRVVE